MNTATYTDDQIARGDHAYANPTIADVAPQGLVGRGPSNPATGANIFDALEDCSMPGQIAGFRALANGAICGAVFAANEFFATMDDEDTEKHDAAQQRMVQQAELYNVAVDRLNPLVTNPFDNPMSLGDAIDFASNNLRNQGAEDDLPDEVLQALGIDRNMLKAIDAEERRKQAQRDAKLREQFRANAEDIASELASYIGDASDDVLDQLVPMQHMRLFDKTSKKLSARMRQALGNRHKYDGGLADAMLLSGDIKAIDKAFTAFVRANKAELSDTAE